jgi:hypothetical protein
MPGLFPIDREPLDDKQQRNDELEHGAGRDEDEAPPGIELRRANQRHGYADGQDGVPDQAQLCEETGYQSGHVQQEIHGPVAQGVRTRFGSGCEQDRR